MLFALLRSQVFQSVDSQVVQSVELSSLFTPTGDPRRVAESGRLFGDLAQSNVFCSLALSSATKFVELAPLSTSHRRAAEGGAIQGRFRIPCTGHCFLLSGTLNCSKSVELSPPCTPHRAAAEGGATQGAIAIFRTGRWCQLIGALKCSNV